MLEEFRGFWKNSHWSVSPYDQGRILDRIGWMNSVRHTNRSFQYERDNDNREKERIRRIQRIYL